MLHVTDKLPKTDITAELVFSTPEQADIFAREYTRKTLMGHSIKGEKVTIWNVTDEIKDWISSYNS